MHVRNFLGAIFNQYLDLLYNVDKLIEASFYHHWKLTFDISQITGLTINFKTILSSRRVFVIIQQQFCINLIW